MQLYVIGLILLPLLIDGLAIFHRGRPRGGMIGSPKRTSRSFYNRVKAPIDELWYTQQLDHFNPTDIRTWQQRYYVNDLYWKKNGPVFIQIGGEGPADPIWMVEGQWIKYAQTHGAICVMLEHRFYGKSHPTADLSVENLRYLSSEQALADLATFREYFNRKYLVSEQSKWISFGGSYPGSLSAWFRLKYPHLVYGAISASSPMTALTDFSEYLVVVRNSLATYDEKCNDAISNATKLMQNMIQSSSGRTELKAAFRLCDSIETQNDVDNFFQTVAGNFEGVVQYNKDNRAFEGARATNITIDVLCKTMLDTTQPNILQRMVNVNDMILNAYDQPCLDAGYMSMINQLTNISWNASAAEGGRQWTYQTCVEFGFFQSSNDPQQPFGNNFPASFFVQQCADIFGPNFNDNLLERGIDFTNAFYGAEGFSGSRVLFVNGAIDPWHALSFTKDPPNNNTAIFLSSTAHCADMYPDAETDPQELKQARQTISDTIGQWLQ
ncbi:unnamed protein product [Rotaria magnacalcarata]|uniref:Serine protease K12H4.7 n=1 Tax=Rotaria magnacalcarata TaxID=392030 RepID=A0A816VZA2_9BILA|nr:unnamed protein product [Rotaria magnacalcarata]CAF3969961.1 unnamed protein product [Rotaria magnacalcarata]